MPCQLVAHRVGSWRRTDSVAIKGIADIGEALVLKELFPTAPRVAGLLDPTAPGFEYQSKELPEVARTLGIEIDFSYARSAAEIEIAFEDIAQNKPAGLMVGASPFFNSRSAQLAALSARHALPVVFQTREFAARGGLLSYGAVSWKLIG
jgi:putative ABC transport system substrate-binding protein